MGASIPTRALHTTLEIENATGGGEHTKVTRRSELRKANYMREVSRGRDYTWGDQKMQSLLPLDLKNENHCAGGKEEGKKQKLEAGSGLKASVWWVNLGKKGV